LPQAKQYHQSKMSHFILPTPIKESQISHSYN
jgi:hypothetical protein